MKKLFLVIGSLILAGCFRSINEAPKIDNYSSSQEQVSKSDISTAERDSYIKEIREEVSRVDTFQSFQLVKKTILGMSTEGAHATYYLQQNNVRKIIVTFFGETGKTDEEIYYKENEPFFIFKKNYHYSKHIMEGGSSDESTVSETRIYIKNGKIISYVSSDSMLAESEWKDEEMRINLINKGLFEALHSESSEVSVSI
jgi:hypothetical protein